MLQQDRDYYERRYRQCLTRAATASDETVSQIHRQLAAAYLGLLEEDLIDRPKIMVWN